MPETATQKVKQVYVPPHALHSRLRLLSPENLGKDWFLLKRSPSTDSIGTAHLLHLL